VNTSAEVDQEPDTSHVAIVALGSNLGDREQYLRLAVSRLGEIVKRSQVFETDPMGPAGQSAYLNMVVVVRTSLDPYGFLRHCQGIESEAMRERWVHWGPRTLDVDLLFFDDLTINDPELTVPHPGITVRRFVLAPLSEVAPDRCPPAWEEQLPPTGVYARGPLDG
jgi:dihydroneopterin aldolase/2-amino-4-hydroxy-6-hydroxymethyldihydropteridine diphosphokinase